MAKKESSVAPKERINVTFKPAIGDAQEEIEIPFKVMVLGDFTQKQDDRTLEDRKPISIDKVTFNDVLEKQDLSLDISVPNRLQSEDQDSELAVNLKFKEMKDFEPANVVEQIPELKKLMELRDALVALKGPLGNAPAFRKAIESVLSDDTSRENILSELGLAAITNKDTEDSSSAKKDKKGDK